MEFKEVQQAMIAAMKARDKERKEAISDLVSAIKKLAIDEGSRENITQDQVARAVLKEMKSVKEQIDTCPDERAELKASYQKTYEIMSEFAPKQLSEEEITEILQTKYAEVLASKNKGMIMKTIMPELKGKADGKMVSSILDGMLA